MRKPRVLLNVVISLSLALGVVLATPRPAEAAIHEIIAALCRAGVLGEVVPPGQVRNGNSLVRALQATGFITSIDESESLVVINFDPTVPNSKFVSAGFDLLIPDGWAPGVDLLLSPLVVPNPDFPAHANCHNYNP